MNKIIYFSAAWCGQCKVVKPMVVNYCNANGIELDVVDAEDESAEGMIAEYNVRNLPTIVLLKDGAFLKRGVGLSGWNEIKALL